MKRFLFLMLITLGFVSCTKKTIGTFVESEVQEYAKCTNQQEFHKWLFDIGPDGTMFEDDGITYAVMRSYDPVESEVQIMVEIKDGVADYHKNEVVVELREKLIEALKHQGKVSSIYIDDVTNWVMVILNNESNYTNAD